MQNIDLLTWFGYLASVVTAISLLMSRPLKLRWLNLIGSLLFAIYGVLINAYPVGAFNAIIVLIDGYYIIQIYKSTAAFKSITVQNHNEVLQLFIAKFGDDINSIFPNFRNDFNSHNFIVLIFREMEVVGVVAGAITGKELEVNVDYTSPSNRDYKPGRYFFTKSELLKGNGILKVKARANTPAHIKYLQMVGFTAKDDYFELIAER